MESLPYNEFSEGWGGGATLWLVMHVIDNYIASCPGIDNYIASYPLKYYHTVNCLGKRLLYSQFKGEILLYTSSQLSVIGLLFNNCLGERLLYSQLSGG